MREALLAWLEAPDEDLAGVAGLSDAARSGLAELGCGATTDPGGGLWVAEDADQRGSRGSDERGVNAAEAPRRGPGGEARD